MPAISDTSASRREEPRDPAAAVLPVLPLLRGSAWQFPRDQVHNPASFMCRIPLLHSLVYKQKRVLDPLFRLPRSTAQCCIQILERSLSHGLGTLDARQPAKAPRIWLTSIISSPVDESPPSPGQNIPLLREIRIIVTRWLDVAELVAAERPSSGLPPVLSSCWRCAELQGAVWPLSSSVPCVSRLAYSVQHHACRRGSRTQEQTAWGRRGETEVVSCIENALDKGWGCQIISSGHARHSWNV